MKTHYLYLALIFLFILSCSKENESIVEDPEDLTYPEVLIKEIKDVSLHSAIVTGEIIKLGDYDIIDHGFVLSKQSEPSLSDNQISLGSIDHLGVFQGTYDNLDQNTNYFVRSFVTYDSDKTIYGDTLSFKTLESNIWVEKSSYSGGHLSRAVSFVIDDQLFVGTGISNSYVNYFYKYNYDNNSWESISDLPSTERANAISFAIGNYGYVGLGYKYDGTHNYYNDIWRYDPLNDSWSNMAEFPGTPRAYSTCFVIDDKAYVTGGSSYGDNDLWEYNSSTDTWTKKADYPGGCSSKGASFSLNNKGYVGFGWLGGTCNDFWEYDPLTDAWIEKENFPGEPRYGAIGFSLLEKGYLACGINQDNNYNFLTDFWEYDHVNDTWTQINTSYPGKGRIHMIVGVIDNKIITGLGTNNIAGGPGNRFDDIWEYIPEQK